MDEYLEWQHLGTRMNCAGYFQQRWLFPMMTKKFDEKAVAKARADAAELEAKIAELEQQRAHRGHLVRLRAQFGARGGLRGAEREAEERALERRGDVAPKESVRRELIRELLDTSRACESKLEPRALRRSTRQELGVRVEEDDVLSGEE